MAELMPTQSIYAKLVGLVGTLYNRGEQGLANDVLSAIREGRMPVTPEGQRLVAETLRSAGYSGTPESFLAQFSAAGNGGQTRGGIGEMVGQGDTAGPGGIAQTAAAAAAAAAGQGGGSGAAQAGGGGVVPSGVSPRNSGDDPRVNQQMLSQISGSDPTQRPGNITDEQIQQVVNGNTSAIPGQGGSGPASGGGGSNPGGFTSAQGQVLAEDDDRLVRFALQAAGLNPDRMNSFTRIVGRALVPLLRARRAAFGIAGDANVGGLPQDIASFAGEMTSGADFFGNARKYADEMMGSENFKNAIAGLSDQDQVAAMFQSLMPLRYAGSNPLIQQSAADTFQRTQNQFNDQLFNVSGQQAAMPGGGVFVDWLQQRGQELDPITRRIFGIR